MGQALRCPQNKNKSGEETTLIQPLRCPQNKNKSGEETTLIQDAFSFRAFLSYLCLLRKLCGQFIFRCETKTKDNVFVIVVAAVQYRAFESNSANDIYTTSTQREWMQANVFNAIRATVPKLQLDDAFEQKHDIAKAIDDELKKGMSAYGIWIVQTRILNIERDMNVKREMNEINEAARMGLAGNEKAEAENILQINFCENVACTSAKDVMDMVLVTQYFDKMKEIGASSKSSGC